MASSRQVRRDDTFYQRVINRSYTRFLADLEPVSILDLFIENEYIPYTQARDIQEIRLSTEQSREILKRVGSKGEIGYNKFKYFLMRTKQEDLVDYLKEQEALLEKDIQMEQRDQRLVKQNVIERVPPQPQTGSARRPNERELMSIAAHVGKNWELLGLSLGIPSTTIDQINLDNSTTILKVYRVLYIWREMNGQEGSVKNLLKVLDNAPEAVNIDLEEIKEVFDSNSATRRNSGNISSPQVAKDLGARSKNEPHIQTEAPVADRMSRMTINQAGDIDRGKGTASKYTVHSASLEQNASLQQDDSISDIGLKKIGNTRRNDPDVSNEFGPDMSRNASEGNVTDGQSVRERSGIDGTDATDVLYNRTQNRTAETKYQERDARTDTVSLDNVSDEPFSLGDVKERQQTDINGMKENRRLQRDAERDERLKNLFSSEDDFPGRLKELNPDNVRDLMDCCGTAIHGVGGFGEVYVSKNEIPGLCMKIAIKKVEMKKKADDLKMRSITNEKLASRTMHFGIVPLLAIGEDEDNMTFYFVTPYFEKGDLFKAIEADNERLKKRTTINLDIDARLRILFQIAAAIDFLHRPVHKFRDAIIHMDIKTLNIVLDKFYNARLIDFGLAREMKEEQHIHTTTIELPHTEGYYRTMKGDKLTKHIDYYNFGVVIRELLTGIPYYVEGKPEDDQLRHQNDLFLEDNLLEMWKYKDEPIEVANELIKLSIDCIEVDDINKVNSITILDKVKDLLKNRNVSRWTPRIEQRNGQNTPICDMCLVYDAVQDKILAHEAMCKCKINVCVSCMRNSFLSPIRCHSCDKDIKPIIGHDWAALLIAGNDTVKEKANGFKEDIEAIETVITSKCPLVMGISDKMVKKILPAKGGVNEFIKDSLKEAVSIFNKKEDLHTIFIYYSGHYYPKAIDGRNGEGFKLGGEQEYMTLEEFQSILSPFLRTSNAPKDSILSSRRLIIVLDCCHTPSLLSSLDKEARGSKANEQPMGSLPKGNSEEPNLQPNSSDTSKNTPFFTCKETDNYSIVQINACRHNQQTVLESGGSVFRKFLVQALTRKAMQKPCLVKAEGGQCEKDCFIPVQFVTMQNLRDYITRHLENSRSEYGQPVIHACNESSHDAKIAYVFNSSADLRFKYTFKNTTSSRTVPQQLFNDIGQLRLHLVNEFVEVMVKKGDIKEPVPADLVDALCIQIKRGPKKKHVEELDSLQKVTGAWNSKREMLVSLREISEIRQGKVGVFLPKGCELNSFFAERYSKKTDDTVCISYMVEFDGLRTLRKDLSNFNKDVQSYITSVIKDVENAQKNGETIGSKLLISFPVQGDGGTLLRDDFVYFQLE